MMRLLGSRVLVALPPKPAEYISASGLVLPKDPDSTFTETRGIVMQLGDKSSTVDLDEARAAVHAWFLEDQGPNYMGPTHVRDSVDRVLMKMQPAAFDAQVGDCILFPPTAGVNICRDGIDYVILDESDILGIVDPLSSEAA
jgi:co-chaperonin GroES (HSP10)